MQDLLTGRIDMCEQISTAFPQIQSGAVKVIVTLFNDGSERTGLGASAPVLFEKTTTGYFALGHKRTSPPHFRMSALPPKEADRSFKTKNSYITSIY
jgi:hypothetical protein